VGYPEEYLVVSIISTREQDIAIFPWPNASVHIIRISGKDRYLKG
jgi:hypothetical protein